MKKIIIALSLALFFNTPAFAASVTTAKNQKVLINLEGDEVSIGDEFFLINPVNHKKTAVIRVTQVKNGKALANVLKGNADAGYTLQAKASSGGDFSAAAPAATEKKSHKNTAVADDSRSSRDTEYLRRLTESFGVVGEFLMNSMQANITDSLGGKGSASMKGTGFGVGGFYEYIATDDISIRLLGALEQFNTSGSTTLSSNGTPYANSTSYDTKITYLSFYGLGKYYFTQNHYRFWGGVGGGFLIAASKSSNALNESNIGTNQVLNLALGADIQMNRKNYIPVSLEYVYFPPSDTVKATAIVLKAGWAWNL